MQSYLVTIFIFIATFAHGQSSSDSKSSKKAVDSSRAEHNSLKEANTKQAFRLRFQANRFRTDTVHYGSDSTVITHLDKDGKLLRKETLEKAKGGCIIGSQEQFFNTIGLLEYSEKWKLSCVDSALKEKAPSIVDPEIKVFSGMQTEMERFQYDSLGRLSVRVWWYYSIGGRRYSYSYGQNTEPTVEISRIPRDEFWR